MTLTSAAQAEIVYTPVYRSVQQNGSIVIDLNNDGIPDFSINAFELSGIGTIYVLPTIAGNENVAAFYRSGRWAAPLQSGVLIGPGAKFFAEATVMANSSSCRQYGPWAHKIGRYLGLEFQIDGKAHFGWARVNVGPCGLALTGYAYETIPAKSILAGQTQEDAQYKNNSGTSDGLPSATLGLLAQGASGLAMWRREEDLSFLSPSQCK
jgi:hypothetical protein